MTRNLDDLKLLTPMNRFFYTAEERHRIYLRRKNGDAKPWTDDPIFRQFYFTNVYRELDKTTEWFRVNVRDPLRDNSHALMATVIFRWFNLISTGEVLLGSGHVADSLLARWDPQVVIAKLGALRAEGQQIFTGAFMINSPAGEPKLEAIVRRITNVWNRRAWLLEHWPYDSMQRALELLTTFDGLGGFMAYEIVCDLRFTKLLEGAQDILTFANPGPGAVRGMYRVLGREIKNKSNSTAPPKPKEWNDTILVLRAGLQAHMTHVFGPAAPPVEAREVEMWLCEFDKFDRLLFGEGQSKRRYPGA